MNPNDALKEQYAPFDRTGLVNSCLCSMYSPPQSPRPSVHAAEQDIVPPNSPVLSDSDESYLSAESSPADRTSHDTRHPSPSPRAWSDELWSIPPSAVPRRPHALPSSPSTTHSGDDRLALLPTPCLPSPHALGLEIERLRAQSDLLLRGLAELRAIRAQHLDLARRHAALKARELWRVEENLAWVRGIKGNLEGGIVEGAEEALGWMRGNGVVMGPEGACEFWGALVLRVRVLRAYRESRGA